MSIANVNSMDSVLPKSEPLQDGYSSSTPSTPEAEAEAEASTQDVVQVQKRKGGRKPIYATSEERKQRNRQAQAAFRERRTEYIKHLENTIKHHEETLQALQQSHRSAADECLMLRYKNSLLERILLEKGIDVQAELRVKGSPHLGAMKASSSGATQPSHLQRAMMNRQQQLRHNPALGPPPSLQPTKSVISGGAEATFSSPSSLQPTPTSQTSSSSTSRSPGYLMPGGVSSPQSESQVQQSQQQHQKRHIPPQQPNPFPPYSSVPNPQTSTTATASPSQPMVPPGPKPHVSAAPSNYYPPSFQKHYDQLDQEYDALADLMGDVEAADEDLGAYAPTYPGQHPGVNPVTGLHESTSMMQGSASDAGSGSQSGGLTQMFDPFDSMLDTDPFGLTASMHFPTPYDYDQSHVRR